MSYQSPIPNISMYAGFAFAEKATNPADIKSYPLSGITVDEGARKRPLNREAVNKLKESISAHGLLQPIGLKNMGSGKPYKLVFGFHRFLAMCELTNEAVERGEQIAYMGSIPAIMFPEDTPDYQIRRAELVENFVRKELTTEEKREHTLELVQIFAEHEGKKVARKNGGARPNSGPRSESSDRNLRSELSPPPEPTAIELAAKELGISTDTVTRRVRKTAEMAGKPNVKLEAITPKQLEEIRTKASENAPSAKEKASEKRKAESKARVEAKDEHEDIIQLAESAIEAILRSYDIEVFKEAARRVWKRRYPNGRIPFQHDGR